jgi:hypothetical protein
MTTYAHQHPVRIEFPRAIQRSNSPRLMVDFTSDARRSAFPSIQKSNPGSLPTEAARCRFLGLVAKSGQASRLPPTTFPMDRPMMREATICEWED